MRNYRWTVHFISTYSVFQYRALRGGEYQRSQLKSQRASWAISSISRHRTQFFFCHRKQMSTQVTPEAGSPFNNNRAIFIRDVARSSKFTLRDVNPERSWSGIAVHQRESNLHLRWMLSSIFSLRDSSMQAINSSPSVNELLDLLAQMRMAVVRRFKCLPSTSGCRHHVD